MKKISIAILALTLCTTSVFAKKIFEFKTGIVESVGKEKSNVMGFKSSSTINSTMYFRDYGNEYVEVGEATSDDGKKSKIMTKVKNGVVYHVDYDEKMIMKMDTKSLGGKFKQQDLEELKKAFGIKKVGEEKILGYKCDVYEGDSIKIWSHKGIELRSKMTIMKGVTSQKVANNVKFNVPVGDDKFKLPDFPIKTMKEIMQMDSGSNKDIDLNDENMQLPSGLGDLLSPEQMEQLGDLLK